MPSPEDIAGFPPNERHPPWNLPLGVPLPSFKSQLKDRALSGESAELSYIEFLRYNYDQLIDIWLVAYQGQSIEGLLVALIPHRAVEIARIANGAAFRAGIEVALAQLEFWVQGQTPAGNVRLWLTPWLFKQGIKRKRGTFVSHDGALENRMRIRIPHR